MTEQTPESIPGPTQPTDDGSQAAVPATETGVGDVGATAGDSLPDTGDGQPAGDGETGTAGDTPDGEKPIWNVQVQGHYPENPENYTIVDLDQPQQ